MGDYLRSLGDCVPKVSKTMVSEEVEKTEEVKSVEPKLEEELCEEMEREMSELAEYYIALERGEPENVVWGTYEDYLKATGVVHEDVVDDQYDPEEDPDDPYFLGVDLDDLAEPPVEPAPLVEMEVDDGLGDELEEGEINQGDYEEEQQGDDEENENGWIWEYEEEQEDDEKSETTSEVEDADEPMKPYNKNPEVELMRSNCKRFGHSKYGKLIETLESLTLK